MQVNVPNSMVQTINMGPKVEGQVTKEVEKDIVLVIPCTTNLV
jgi:hypothetical protein